MTPAISVAAAEVATKKKPCKARRFLQPALLGREDAATFLSISASTLDRMSAAGEVPAPVRLSGRIAWGRAELASWVRHGCPARSTWSKLWPQLRDRHAKRG